MATDAELLAIPTLRQTNLDGREGLKFFSRGKVRDTYSREGKDTLYMITSDRISAFDKVLPWLVPEKGRTLTGTAAYTFRSTRDITQNHLIDVPDPNVMVVQKVNVRYPIEFIVRGYIAGSLWKAYAKGKRKIYGYDFPEGLKKNQKLPEPIVTNTTKAEVGHDMPIESREDCIAVLEKHMGMTRGEAERNYDEVVEKSVAVYKRGCAIAGENGADEVDTKYEWGLLHGANILIDEANTPDSSRFVDKKDYEEKFAKGEEPTWFDKQYVRYYLEGSKWTGDECGPLPAVPENVVAEASRRYQMAHKLVTGQDLRPLSEPISEERILKNLKGW
jgi:phosphoribosylaminoimidazole-succinocarboxamide synthase